MVQAPERRRDRGTQLPLIIDPMNLTLDIAKNRTIATAIDDGMALESRRPG
jgi:hypothetical protein